MAATFIEANKDFVLKLNIKASNGSTQVRRVRLPRIDDGAGGVSYDELVGIAITFIFPDDGSVEEPDNYRVVLSYTDVDADLVTIASSDELVDAIEQFADSRVLRISAEVRQSRKGKPQRRASMASSVASASLKAPPAPSTSSASTPASNATKPPPPASRREPPIAHVFENIVGVMTAAVSSINEDRKAGSKKARSAPQTLDELVGDAVEACSKVAADVEELADALDGLDSPSEKASSQPEPPVQTDRGVENKEETEETAQESPVEVEPPKSPPAQEKTEEVAEPFIHARHTCDGCLMTPIVGKRYHAKNIADYDLCAKCYGNYSGTEFVFEVAELDRDRAFQEKWRRRREKIMDRAGRGRGHKFHGGKGRRGGGRFGGFARHHPMVPPPPAGSHHHGPSGVGPFPHPVPPPPPPVPSHHGHHHFFGPPPPPHHYPRPYGSAPPPPPPPHHRFFQQFCAPQPANEDDDEDLKEAIRRSMVESHAPKESQEDDSVPTVATGSTVEDVSKTEEPIEDIEAPRVIEDVAPAAVEATPIVETEPEIVVSVSSAPIVAGVETVCDDDDDVESVVSFAMKPTAKPKAAPFSPSTDSFAEDAVGHGEVAEEVGIVMDKFARLFDEMIQSDSPQKMNDVPSVAADSKPESVSVAASGAVIVDGEDEEPSAVGSISSSAEGDWHVVSGTGSVAGANNDDASEIGRAAGMLGSALFNSDMKSSGEVVSHLSESSCSDSISSASSVPSTLPSLSSGAGPAGSIPINSRERWAPQLTQLRECGFSNENQCIEIMERLEAANIGVGSTDEITVAQVVHEMFK